MTKQWKQSLEQSDILSDGTPFDGANIDAPISSAGQGVDWSAKTFEIVAYTNSGHESSTLLDISGSGYLVFGRVASSNTLAVEIDNGDVYSFDSSPTMPFSPIRFNNQIKITATYAASAEISAGVLLDS